MIENGAGRFDPIFFMDKNIAFGYYRFAMPVMNLKR